MSQFVYRASHLGLLYLGSLVVLLVYSILYGLTAKEARWLGAATSGAVIILGLLFLSVLCLVVYTSHMNGLSCIQKLYILIAVHDFLCKTLQIGIWVRACMASNSFKVVL